MPKVFIIVKENDSPMPPDAILERLAKEPDAIMVCLDKTSDNLRPFVKGAPFEVLYENGSSSN